MAKSTAPEAKSQSLASIGFQLPGALANVAPPIVSGLVYAPYITFAHPTRKDEWAKLQAKFGMNLKEGNMYLVDGNNLSHLENLKCGYVCGTQFWVHKSPSGDLIAFSRNPQPEPFREHVEAVVLVYHENRVIPANITFRTTKCGAAKTMDDTLRLAGTKEWGDLSPIHLATMPIPQPFFRFYANVFLGQPRNSKRTGLPYRTLVAQIAPTTSTEVMALRTMVDDPATSAAMEKAAERYEYVLKELEPKSIDK